MRPELKPIEIQSAIASHNIEIIKASLERGLPLCSEGNQVVINNFFQTFLAQIVHARSDFYPRNFFSHILEAVAKPYQTQFEFSLEDGLFIESSTQSATLKKEFKVDDFFAMEDDLSANTVDAKYIPALLDLSDAGLLKAIKANDTDHILAAIKNGARVWRNNPNCKIEEFLQFFITNTNSAILRFHGFSYLELCHCYLVDGLPLIFQVIAHEDLVLLSHLVTELVNNKVIDLKDLNSIAKIKLSKHRISLEAGGEPIACSGLTPLRASVFLRNCSMMELLIKQKYNYFPQCIVDNQVYSLLDLARCADALDTRDLPRILNYLFRSGVRFTYYKDQGDDCLLNYAVELNDVNFVASVLNSSYFEDFLRTNSIANLVRNPLSIAIQNENREMVKLLIQVRNKNPIEFDLLLCFFHERYPESLLHTAIRIGDFASVEMLLNEKKPEDYLRFRDNQIYDLRFIPFIHYAIFFGKKEIVRELLRRFPHYADALDPNFKFTPLHIADIVDNSQEIVNALKEVKDYKSNVNVTHLKYIPCWSHINWENQRPSKEKFLLHTFWNEQIFNHVTDYKGLAFDGNNQYSCVRTYIKAVELRYLLEQLTCMSLPPTLKNLSDFLIILSSNRMLSHRSSFILSNLFLSYFNVPIREIFAQYFHDSQLVLQILRPFKNSHYEGLLARNVLVQDFQQNNENLTNPMVAGNLKTEQQVAESKLNFSLSSNPQLENSIKNYLPLILTHKQGMLGYIHSRGGKTASSNKGPVNYVSKDIMATIWSFVFPNMEVIVKDPKYIFRSSREVSWHTLVILALVKSSRHAVDVFKIRTPDEKLNLAKLEKSKNAILALENEFLDFVGENKSLDLLKRFNGSKQRVEFDLTRSEKNILVEKAKQFKQRLTATGFKSKELLAHNLTMKLVERLINSAERSETALLRKKPKSSHRKRPSKRNEEMMQVDAKDESVTIRLFEISEFRFITLFKKGGFTRYYAEKGRFFENLIVLKENPDQQILDPSQMKPLDEDKESKQNTMSNAQSDNNETRKRKALGSINSEINMGPNKRQKLGKK